MAYLSRSLGALLGLLVVHRIVAKSGSCTCAPEPNEGAGESVLLSAPYSSGQSKESVRL
jgi:hypothetical protein